MTRTVEKSMSSLVRALDSGTRSNRCQGIAKRMQRVVGASVAHAVTTWRDTARGRPHPPRGNKAEATATPTWLHARTNAWPRGTRNPSPGCAYRDVGASNPVRTQSNTRANHAPEELRRQLDEAAAHGHVFVAAGRHHRQRAGAGEKQHGSHRNRGHGEHQLRHSEGDATRICTRGRKPRETTLAKAMRATRPRDSNARHRS